MVDPWPPNAGNRDIGFAGARMLMQQLGGAPPIGHRDQALAGIQQRHGRSQPGGPASCGYRSASRRPEISSARA